MSRPDGLQYKAVVPRGPRVCPWRVVLFLGVAVVFYAGYAWLGYRRVLPRPGFVVVKPDLSPGKTVMVLPDGSDSYDRPCTCRVPRWAKVVRGFDQIMSPSGAHVHVGLMRQLLDRATAKGMIRLQETSDVFDEDRVYAGPWMGFRRKEPSRTVEEHKKAFYRNYEVETVKHRLSLDLTWPAGSPKAEKESEEIAAFVLYSVKEEQSASSGKQRLRPKAQVPQTR